MCLVKRSHMRKMHRQRKTNDGINWRRMEALMFELSSHCNRRNAKDLKKALISGLYMLLKPWRFMLLIND